MCSPEGSWIIFKALKKKIVKQESYIQKIYCSKMKTKQKHLQINKNWENVFTHALQEILKEVL